jgi:hypothetical protein
MLVQTLDIALHRLGPLRHGAIEPGADRDMSSPHQVASETLRDFEASASSPFFIRRSRSS